MNKSFLLVFIMLTGCNSLKYQSESTFNPRTHNFSYTEISDSSLMFKRVQVNLHGDSIIIGKITGISKDRIMITTQFKHDTVSVPFMETKSFQVSGFPLPYYNRASFGAGLGGTFMFLLSLYSIRTSNNAVAGDEDQPFGEILTYLGVSLLGGVYFSNQLNYSEEELKGQIVTVFVK